MEKLAEISKVGDIADQIGYLRGNVIELHRKTTSSERKKEYLDILEMVASLSAKLLNVIYLIGKK